MTAATTRKVFSQPFVGRLRGAGPAVASIFVSG